MVLPGIMIFFGTILAERAIDTLYTQDAQDTQDRQAQEITRPQPTAPPEDMQTSQIGTSKYFSGIVKDNYFYQNGVVLNLKSVNIINICVCPLSQTTDRPYSGKIYVMSGKGVVFKHEYNERVRHITLPGSGLEVTNATIKVKVKTSQAVALQYTVVFSDGNNSVLA